MIFLPASSKEVDDSDDKLLFAEIFSSFSNFDQVAINQVPESESVKVKVWKVAINQVPESETLLKPINGIVGKWKCRSENEKVSAQPSRWNPLIFAAQSQLETSLNCNDLEFLPWLGLIEAFLVLFNHSFKELADLAEHLKPGEEHEKDEDE